MKSNVVLTWRRQERVLKSQIKYIREHIGFDASQRANYAWGSSHTSIATKVYGSNGGYLESHIHKKKNRSEKVVHVFTPFKS
jgi:hypothetical protein